MLPSTAACRAADVQPALLLGACCTRQPPVFSHILCCQQTLLQVLQCQKPSAGFGGSPRHDAHILYTLSAVQILALYNKTDLLDADAVAACELGFLQACARLTSMPVLCLCPCPDGRQVLWCLIITGSELQFWRLVNF